MTTKKEREIAVEILKETTADKIKKYINSDRILTNVIEKGIRGLIEMTGVNEMKAMISVNTMFYLYHELKKRLEEEKKKEEEKLEKIIKKYDLNKKQIEELKSLIK